MMKYFCILLNLTSILYPFTALPQGSAGDKAKYEYRYLIDMPSAGILEKGFVGITSDILPEGVLIVAIEAGIFKNVSFGISYGGRNILGSGEVDWYKWPGINLRVRILNESILLPAVTLGFDSQGKGDYVNKDSRYQFKSPGFFGAVSKNFEFAGYLSLHGTVNYSLESKDGDNFVNLKVGLEKTLGSSLSFILEYDFAFNDNKSESYGQEKGYLNTGFRWTVSDGVTLGLDLRDLLSNKSWNQNNADRALKIEFIKSIF